MVLFETGCGVPDEEVSPIPNIGAGAATTKGIKKKKTETQEEETIVPSESRKSERNGRDSKENKGRSPR